VQGKTEDPNDVVKRRKYVPGPGSYAAKENFKSTRDSGFALDREKKSPSYINYKAKSPPPGSYEPSVDLKYKTLQGSSFGREQRPEIKKTQNPGPGSYKLR